MRPRNTRGSELKVGFHASHEQHPPSALIEQVHLAERAGFEAAMCSDHLAPFSERQGHSGFAWSWLGAALASSELSFGTVCAPGQRYHPAVVAQAIATLAEMFPGRFWVALGSGENLNEHVTGEPWPVKRERMTRLLECVDVIRRLLAGEEVSHRGVVTVEQARVYVRPSEAPPLYAAAISAETAEWAGGWADGLITVAAPPEEMARVIEAFKRGGGEGKPLLLQTQVSYAATDQAAAEEAFRRWPNAALPAPLLADLRLATDIDLALSNTRPEDVASKVRVSSDPARHLEWLREAAGLGFDTTYVHNVASDQRAFIDMYAESVLPVFRGASVIEEVPHE